ncbi:MAG: insulinase family protein, partial [Candidatus Zixiibacteriota bacterium]
MIVKYAMFFVLLCLLLPQPAQGQALESKAAKYMLPNGMQVILVEKHANPMIACMVYVNAGSKYETDANNGVTHFLEHLLFDGTE